MKRSLFLIYGIFCYLVFFGGYAWLAAFVGNLFIPKSIDTGPSGSVPQAILVDVLLILIFGVQHSVMARPAFKKIWTRLIPQPIERSTYVLISSLATMLLMWQWRPIDTLIWQFEGGFGRWLMMSLFAVGWLAVPTVSLMINHFDLFGVRQVWLHFQNKPYRPLPFRTPLAYGRVRHPLYVAWAVAFWCTPVMTAGHLLFASLLTVYMLVAVVFEERDLIVHFGEHYRSYCRNVPRFFPRMKKIAFEDGNVSHRATT